MASNDDVSMKDNDDDKEKAARLRHEWDAMLESCARVSIASFGGSLAGWGIGAQKQAQQAQQPPQPTQQSPTTTKQLRSRGAQKKPPKVPVSVASPRLVTARSWGVACCIFSLMLEVTRLVSPSNLIADELLNNSPTDKKESSNSDRNEQSTSVKNDQWLQEEEQQKLMTSLSDYVLGGGLAGMLTSGVWAKKRGPGGPRSFVVQGFMAGASLGLVGGLAQAGLDIFTIYDARRMQEENAVESPESS